MGQLWCGGVLAAKWRAHVAEHAVKVRPVCICLIIRQQEEVFSPCVSLTHPPSPHIQPPQLRFCPATFARLRSLDAVLSRLRSFVVWCSQPTFQEIDILVRRSFVNVELYKFPLLAQLAFARTPSCHHHLAHDSVRRTAHDGGCGDVPYSSCRPSASTSPTRRLQSRP